jgi:hypothetical protein
MLTGTKLLKWRVKTGTTIVPELQRRHVGELFADIAPGRESGDL